MQIIFRSAIVAAVLAAALPAAADRRSDDANSEIRNDSMWAERETRRDVGRARDKAGISQVGGKIVVDASRGKGGGAAYLSKWRTDWNDSFSVNFALDLSAPATSNSRQAAVSGIAFGSDSNDKFSLTKAYRTGVTVEARQSAEGKTLQIVARKNGRVIASSARIPMTDGVHNFEVSWVANPATRTISVKLFEGAAAAPLLVLNGVQEAFSGNGSTLAGIGSALFGYSSGNMAFTSSFDDFSYSGDDHSSDDSDDDSWCDSDDSDDDGVEDGDDHGGRGGDDDAAVDSASFAAGMQVAIDANPSLDLIEAEVEDGTIESIFKQSSTHVLVVRVRLSDSSIASSVSRLADEDELEKFDAAGLATVSPSAALAQIMAQNPGTTVHGLELEDERNSDEDDDSPSNDGIWWEAKLMTSDGIIIKRAVRADV